MTLELQVHQRLPLGAPAHGTFAVDGRPRSLARARTGLQCAAMKMGNPECTTVAVQHYLDELVGMPGDTPAEPIVRALLARSVDRLHMLCASLLHRSYPRLTRGPLNLSSDEMLGAVVERLIKAMRQVRPPTVRQFFALANQHVRWELNGFARRLDERDAAVEGVQFISVSL
jgi:hypothetical protein